MSETLITLLILGIAAGGVTVYVLNYKPLRKSKVKDLYAEGLDLLITGRRKSAYKNFKDINNILRSFLTLIKNNAYIPFGTASPLHG